MKKNEIFIGREVAKGEYPVDKQYGLVGRKHARMIRKPDGIYIEDLDSANGTFVNGKSVKLKKISTSDKITLGGVDYYVLKINEVLKLLPISDEDFQRRFMELKQIYDNYQTESNRLQTKGQEDMMIKRMLPTMLSGTFTGIISLLVGNNLTQRLSIAIIGGMITVAVFLLATKMASKSTQLMREHLNMLNENFELEYVCPACGVSFRGRSWEFLRKTGKCPACQRNFHTNS